MYIALKSSNKSINNNEAPEFKINNETVPIVNSCKYLGFILSDDFSVKEYISKELNHLF